MEADQGAVGFVGFSHQPFTGSIAGIAAEGGHTPPMIAVGSSPALWSRLAIKLLVVVLP